MKLRTTFGIAMTLCLIPLLSHGDEPTATGSDDKEMQGGDGDPGVYDVAPVGPTHPVQIALDVAPRCGGAPDWPAVMGQYGVDAASLRAAIVDGSVGLHDLRRAIGALSVIGSADDMQAMWNAADDLGWEYVVDAVSDVATDQEVLAAQARLAGSTRRDILAAWGRRGDLPNDVLDAALSDSDPRVRRNGARLALASDDPDNVDKGLEVCASDSAVASVAHVCP
jgi:hypothetical protein